MAQDPDGLPEGVWEFGPYRLDPLERQLYRGAEPVPLKPKVLDTLVVLVAAEGRLVPRTELIDAVWPDVVVEPGNLDGNVAAIRRALGEDAAIVETQRGRGYRVTVPVTRRPRGRPEAEPAPAPAPAEAPAPSLAPTAPAPRERSRRRLFLPLAAALALAAIGTLVAVRASVRPAPGPSAPRRVAVLPLSNLGERDEDAWLASALRETLRAELSSAARVEPLPAETVRRAWAELKLAESGTLSRETLERLRAATGADVLVSGSYLVGGDGSLRLDVWVQDCRTGGEVGTLTQSGTVAALLPVLGSAGAKLRGILGAGEGKGWVAEGLPRSPAALRLYVEGLERLAGFETASARDLLVEAAAEEPGSALVRVALAEAWDQLGYTDRARSEAEAALTLTSGLPRAAKLAAEGRAHLVAGRNEEAVAAFRALLALHPDSLEDGLRLSRALRRARQAAPAREVLGRLRRLPPPAGTDPRIEIEQALASHWVRDYPSMLEEAKRAERRAREAGLPVLLARALGTRANAELSLEDDEACRRSAVEAAQLARSYGEPSLEVEHLTTLGWALLNLGEREAAAAALERGLTLARSSGSLARIRSILSPLADLRLWSGELHEARALLEERVALARETGSTGSEVYALVWLADLERLAGDLDGAGEAAGRALTLARKGGGYLGDACRTSAELALARGAPAEALALAEEEARAFTGSGPGARSTAFRLRARALLSLGRAAEAERAAAEAVALLEPSRRPFQMAGARALWARTLAATGDPARAREVLSRERESWPRLAPVERLLARLSEGEALLALGREPEALAAAASVEAEAREAGLEGVAAQAALLRRGSPGR